MTTNQIRIIIVDDHPLMREGITLALQRQAEIEIVGEGSNGQEAVSLAMRLQPDIVLMDILMPDVSGLDALAKIESVAPRSKVIMLTASEDAENLIASIRSGAKGYLLKGARGEDLAYAIRSVHRGNTYIAPELVVHVINSLADDPDPTPFSSLTSREHEVLILVARGLSNREVGQELKLAEKTIKHYMTAIMQKLNVRSRVEAALLAQKAGLQ